MAERYSGQMKNYLIFTLVAGAFLLPEVRSSPESAEIQAQREGLKKWETFVDQISQKQNPDKDDLDQLARGILKLDSPNIYSIEEAKMVRNRMIDVAISNPGHADYFRTQLLEALAAKKAAIGTYDSGPAQAD